MRIVRIAALLALAAGPVVAEERFTHDAEGNVTIRPLPVPESLRNPWPADEEAAFQARCRDTIKLLGNRTAFGNTFFENEKQSYPGAMFTLLSGDRKKAVAFLQSEDADAGRWHKETAGIDFYACFTLKGQVRKYFFFGDELDPAYRKRMLEGAKAWTASDPLTRKHPQIEKPVRKPGSFDPESTGLCVDSRNTDNLRAMRDTSVYLFAEEAGNEEVRKLYKEKIRKYVVALYHVGMGEWDSENYHAHTFAPYLNLYDFAKDEETRTLAKAALDWLSVAAATKYYRGGWGGATKRDYGGASRVYGSGAARFFHLYFGDCPLPNTSPERDQIHAITSAYRPPLAALLLARNAIDAPVETLSAKPTYEVWKPGNDTKPEFHETLFFGKTFRLGSCVSAGAADDVGAFKLTMFNSKRGVDYFLANSTPVIGHQGKQAGDQIGQFRNLAIWLRPAQEGTTFWFLEPKAAEVVTENGVRFVGGEKTFLAIRPINLTEPKDEPITTTKQGAKGTPPETVPDERYAGDRMLKATAAKAEGYCGFALEVGEGPGTFAEFREAVAKKGALDVSKLADGRARLLSSTGDALLFTHDASGRPVLARNGVGVAWDKRGELYKPVGESGPVSLGWKQGTLTVKAGGKSFTATVTADGKATWKAEP